jgi:hypothetical protein
MMEKSDSEAGESVSAGKGGSHKGGPKQQPSLREELEQAAAGLYYMSESDYPYKFFTLPSEGEKDLTPEGFLNRLGLSQQWLDESGVSTGDLIEERSLADFFPNEEDLAERHSTDTTDPDVMSEWKKVQQLLEVLNRRLRGITVFRVGQVEIRCYITGLDEQNNLAGLVTTAVET